MRIETSTSAGLHWSELETPALVLDRDLAVANIEAMAAWAEGAPVALRPHVKVHKSPELARLQVEAGVVGLTVATPAEAVAMLAAGIEDVMVANEVVQEGQLAVLVAASEGKRLSLCVDHAANVETIAAAARAAGSEVGVLVDVDTGMARCGVRGVEEAVELATLASGLEGLRFEGVSGYEGHCMAIVDPGARAAAAAAAMDHLCAVAAAISAAGVPVPVISAGGTGTYDLTGADPRVTELQAGSYVVMDSFHRGLVAEFPVALTVVATVISRHGDRVVLDAGHKAVCATLAPPTLIGHRAELAFINEEHSGFDVDGSDLKVGDVVRLVSGYAPLTVNLYDRYNVVSAERMVESWPILARYGPPTGAAVRRV